MCSVSSRPGWWSDANPRQPQGVRAQPDSRRRTRRRAHRELHDEMAAGLRDFLMRYPNSELEVLVKVLRDLMASRKGRCSHQPGGIAAGAVPFVTVMSKAVRFDQFGDIDVLDVRDVERPQPRAARFSSRSRPRESTPARHHPQGGHAGHIPYDVPVRTGQRLRGRRPETGSGVDEFSVGDEVIGFSEKRASHADSSSCPPKPHRQTGGAVVGGGGRTVCSGHLRLCGGAGRRPGEGRRVAVAGAAGGVGSIAVQLAGQTVPLCWGSLARRTTSGCVRTASSRELRRRSGRAAAGRGARRPHRRVPGLLRWRLCRAGRRRVGRRARPGEHHHRFRRRRTVQGADCGQRRRRQRRRAGGTRALAADGRLEVPIAEVFALDDVRTHSAPSSSGTRAGSWCFARSAASAGREGPLPRGTCRWPGR